MSDWKQLISGHTVHSSLQKLKIAISDLEAKVDEKEQVPGGLSRLGYITGVAGRLLATSEPLLLSTSLLDSLNNPLV